jgi:PAS domain-containing protein
MKLPGMDGLTLMCRFPFAIPITHLASHGTRRSRLRGEGSEERRLCLHAEAGGSGILYRVGPACRSTAALHREVDSHKEVLQERAHALEQVTQELRESEERFRRLAETTFEAIAITEHGRIVKLNTNFLQLFGYRDLMCGYGRNRAPSRRRT